ncbi:MAG: LysE family translocator [Saprospiraceae bacterium]|nr:LysE family translocator [Saprospiraceae bacterium]
MTFFLNGILLGLALSMLVGPLLLALVQTGLEQGIRAGLFVGLGIWVSDGLFVLATYYGLTEIEQLTNWPGFELTLGLVGGAILILFGLYTVLQPAQEIDWEHSETSRYHSFGALWMKGFLINTINPFTVFFWTGLAGSLLAETAGQKREAWWFYIGVLLTIVVFDSLKVVLAKKVRRHLHDRLLKQVRRGSGLALIAFGIVLIVRVLL